MSAACGRRLMLVGGSAGAGKTTVARHLSRALGAGWLQMDTLWVAMRAALPPGSRERVLLDVDERIRSGNTTVESLLQQQVDAAEFVCQALAAALDIELASHKNLIVDGAWLLPSFVAGFSSLGTTIHPVFIHETDCVEVKRAMRTRSFHPQTMPWQALGAETSWVYGNWLAAEAGARALPVVPARPRDGLMSRVRAALQV